MRTGGIESLDDARSIGGVWVDVLEPDEAALQPIAEAFGLHPLAIEDCLHYPQRPKIDYYPTNVFLIWLAPRGTDDLYRASVREIDAFLGRDFLITVHRDRMDAIDALVTEPDCCLPRGVQWMLHAVIDRTVDGLLPLVDVVADRLEDLEDLMLDGATKKHLEALHVARRRLVGLHKIVAPERDIIRGLSRSEEFISEDAYRYFADIGDHLARVQDSIETYRDVASSAMDIYLSSVSNRLNVVMKQLTVVATIFMPLTLISGIYGMNFQYFPELHWRYGYQTVLIAMGLIAAGMIITFRRRGWW